MVQVTKFKKILEQHQYLAVDASVFIYAFEQHVQYGVLSKEVFELVAKPHKYLIASILTLSEILVQPYKLKNLAVAQLYEQLFLTLPNFSAVEINHTIAKQGAELRAKYNIMLPDALNIASALNRAATIFITNDFKLKRVKEIKVVCLKNYIQ